MSDNVLKKDFNKKDVERLRNLVKGKAGERTTQGIGYTKKEETQLKLSGELDKHTKEVHNKEIDKPREEYTQFMNMKMSESNSGFITEAGEVEKWDGGINKERAEEALREGIKYLKSLKK